MEDVNSALQTTSARLFVDIGELDILCTLRSEIIAALRTDDETNVFEKQISTVLVTKIAQQLTRLMTTRTKVLHTLITMATDILTHVKGMPQLSIRL